MAVDASSIVNVVVSQDISLLDGIIPELLDYRYLNCHYIAQGRSNKPGCRITPLFDASTLYIPHTSIV